MIVFKNKTLLTFPIRLCNLVRVDHHKVILTKEGILIH